MSHLPYYCSSALIPFGEMHISRSTMCYWPSSSEPLVYNILLRLPLCASMLAVTPSGPLQEARPLPPLNGSRGGCECILFQTGSALRWWKELISLVPLACNNQLQVTASDLEMYWICAHTMGGFEMHIARVMRWRILHTLGWKQTKYGSGDAFFFLGGLISPRNTPPPSELITRTVTALHLM